MNSEKSQRYPDSFNKQENITRNVWLLGGLPVPTFYWCKMPGFQNTGSWIKIFDVRIKRTDTVKSEDLRKMDGVKLSTNRVFNSGLVMKIYDSKAKGRDRWTTHKIALVVWYPDLRSCPYILPWYNCWIYVVVRNCRRKQWRRECHWWIA